MTEERNCKEGDQMLLMNKKEHIKWRQLEVITCFVYEEKDMP
jgi:hypothetical protein